MPATLEPVQEPAPRKTSRDRLPLTFILLVLVIDAMGIGIIMPVMPDLLRDVMGGSLAQAAFWGGVLASSFAVMQFLFSPAVGSLSDYYGRRPVILVALGVVAADYLVMGFAWTIWMILGARVVAGIGAATQATAAAFIADISAPEEKAARFGLMGAAFGVGFVLGPMIGGLLGQIGPRAPFFAAAAIVGISLVLGFLVLPETVTDRTRRQFKPSLANPFNAFNDIGALPGVGRLLVFFFVYESAFMVYPIVWAYYATARYGWSPGMIGLSLAGFGLSMALVQGLLIRVILKYLGDRGTVVFGLSFNIMMLSVFGLVSNGTLALALTPFAAFGAVVFPAIQGMMSRRVGDDSQGQLQGVLTSIAAVAMVGSPLIMTSAFSLGTANDAGLYLPGAPFFLASGLLMICLAMVLTTPRALRI